MYGVCGRACDGGVVEVFFHEDAHVHILGLIVDEMLEESGFDVADFIAFSDGDAEWVAFEADAFAVDVEWRVCEFYGDIKVLSGDTFVLCDVCNGESFVADDVAVVVVEFAQRGDIFERTVTVNKDLHRVHNTFLLFHHIFEGFVQVFVGFPLDLVDALEFVPCHVATVGWDKRANILEESSSDLFVRVGCTFLFSAPCRKRERFERAIELWKIGAYVSPCFVDGGHDLVTVGDVRVVSREYRCESVVGVCFAQELVVLAFERVKPLGVHWLVLPLDVLEHDNIL